MTSDRVEASYGDTWRTIAVVYIYTISISPVSIKGLGMYSEQLGVPLRNSEQLEATRGSSR